MPPNEPPQQRHPDPILAPVEPQGEAKPMFEVERPRVRLDDVAGMHEVKAHLESTFLGPMRNPELAQMYGQVARGSLFTYGPPGCGKTFIARAIAGELQANFVHVTLADIMGAHWGETEKAIHAVFEQARAARPCVIFFDEFDAIGGRRTSGNASSKSLRMMASQLLVELDGVAASSDGIYVLAATNRPWDIDPALRRSGRFDRTVLVLPPDDVARGAIVAGSLRNKPAAQVDIGEIVRRTREFSGADLSYVVDTAVQQGFAHIIGYLDAGRYDRARELASAELAQDPTSARLHAVMARAELGLEHYEAAERHAGIATHDPAVAAPAWQIVSNAVRHLPGRRQDALAAAANAVRLDPEHWGYHASLAATLTDVGRQQEALGEGQIAVQLTGGDPAAWAEATMPLAYHQAANVQKELALETAATALAVDPTDVQLQQRYLRVQSIAGRHAQGLATALSVLRASPTDRYPRVFASIALYLLVYRAITLLLLVTFLVPMVAFVLPTTVLGSPDAATSWTRKRRRSCTSRFASRACSASSASPSPSTFPSAGAGAAHPPRAVDVRAQVAHELGRHHRRRAHRAELRGSNRPRPALLLRGRAPVPHRDRALVASRTAGWLLPSHKS
ncbi:ATP-binding protein [Gulosibacter sediminis]|uniref:ATP-binding protein n=1 Tax=Gulosibacter sediminis TaxID=1729695 RepID=UPI001B7D7947|nr:ATP-binding protein [Gulosibacter sediminis]